MLTSQCHVSSTQLRLMACEHVPVIRTVSAFHVKYRCTVVNFPVDSLYWEKDLKLKMSIKLGTKTISISFGSNLFWLPFRSARKAINERLDAVFLLGIFHRDLLKPFRATTLSLAVSSFMSSTTINCLKITFVLFGYQMLPVYWMTKIKAKV